MVYVNKDVEVRFHCFGTNKRDWDIYGLIILRKSYRFRMAQKVWAAHWGVVEFEFDDGGRPCIPEPDETPEPDEQVGFGEPKEHDEKLISALDDAAPFYHDLLMSNEDRFKCILD